MISVAGQQGHDGSAALLGLERVFHAAMHESSSSRAADGVRVV